jgi:kynureninase
MMVTIFTASPLIVIALAFVMNRSTGTGLNPLHATSAFEDEGLTFNLPTDNPSKHFFLPPNIIYLNVATLGPMPRCALQSSVEDWKLLESNPCELFDWHDDPPLRKSRLDAVRAKAASMLGAEEVNELAFVQSTTYGLHMVAQGLVSSGFLSKDREQMVLTTVRSCSMCFLCFLITL